MSTGQKRTEHLGNAPKLRTASSVLERSTLNPDADLHFKCFIFRCNGQKRRMTAWISVSDVEKVSGQVFTKFYQ